MPPRAILKMKLGGSDSELDGLDHVVVFVFLTCVDQLLRQLLWSAEDVSGGQMLLSDPRVDQFWRCLASVNIFSNAISFLALKYSLIRYRSSHRHLRVKMIYHRAA
jgi:hypothetical protein